ncbi:MAG TPA: hypothetical protein VHR66_15060 [Gemmataceae bacterium]|jgi:hypothetical protein|nr:hypothetical protein [Gemmataceae bacterium]
MPVIRGQAEVSVITAEQRKQVAEQLAMELAGKSIPDGPIIFEIPLDSQGRIDVLVMWEAWKPFSSTDRSNMIIEAYKASNLKIAQALGVTYQEAVEQQVLPYAVLPMIRQGEVNEEDVKKAMLAEGGILLKSGKIDLRFPTMLLAEQAHKRLTDALPKGYWSIVQTVGYIQ